MNESIEKMKNGVVLAELGGYGDGPYCAKHAAGAALAMLGSYIVDTGDDVPYPKEFVFKSDPSIYSQYLRKHVAAGRRGGAQIGVSVATVSLADTIAFLAAAEEAGADYVSLCAHSTMEMFTKHSLGEELLRRQNTELMKQWASEILSAVGVPVIFKISLLEIEETVTAVDTLASIGIPIIHVNVVRTDAGSSGITAIERLTGRCQCLIAGGGIRNAADANRVIDAGADVVAIGTAAMKDAGLCGSVQRALSE